MINSRTTEYYHASYSSSLSCLSEYIANKTYQDKKINYIIIIFLLAVLISVCILSKPIFAYSNNDVQQLAKIDDKIHLQKNFEQNIKNKYLKSHISFPTKGIAHVKKTVYIKNKPIRINIIEIDTKVNSNLSIKPQTASSKLNSKKTIRKIAKENNALIAINGGYFKPQSGIPLGALMIDRNVLTGDIYNRVGIAIFDDGKNIDFKMDNISFDIIVYNNDLKIKIDNINQPRMLSAYSLLYTSAWGKYSPKAPKGGYNLLVKDNNILEISQNPIEITQNSFVISAPKNIIDKIVKHKNLYIDIKLQENLKNARHIIAAGPYLVRDSEIFVDTKAQKLQSISGKNPRSAIGFKRDGTFMITTIDGREKDSVGMTLNELAILMKKIGCDYAMNFDGGSSSALYVDGQIANHAHNKEGVAISNALLISEKETNIYLSSLD